MVDNLLGALDLTPLIGLVYFLGHALALFEEELSSRITRVELQAVLLLGQEISNRLLMNSLQAEDVQPQQQPKRLIYGQS